MKKMISCIKSMDKTKQIAVCFILASFIFIIGFSCLHKPIQQSTSKENPIIVEVNNVEDEEYTVEENQEEIDNSISQSDTTVDDVKESTDIQKKQISQQKEDVQETSPEEIETTQEVQDELISISIQVIGMNDDVMIDEIRDFEKESTAYDVLKILTNEKGIKVLTSGYGSMVYVKGIGDLKEREHGTSSGWMYKVNDISPNIGAGSYQLKDGDHVVWYYVYE